MLIRHMVERYGEDATDRGSAGQIYRAPETPTVARARRADASVQSGVPHAPLDGADHLIQASQLTLAIGAAGAEM